MTQSEIIIKLLSSREIKDRFISSGIIHLSLFWSYARNEATESSDIDLVIELSTDHSVTFWTLDKLQEVIIKKCGVKKVEFVTKRKIHPFLKENIEKDIITIF